VRLVTDLIGPADSVESTAKLTDGALNIFRAHPGDIVKAGDSLFGPRRVLPGFGDVATKTAENDMRYALVS
jgi:hypothetical protein